jgi:hypothetical protein
MTFFRKTPSFWCHFRHFGGNIKMTVLTLKMTAETGEMSFSALLAMNEIKDLTA